jgi:hypothetical protein
MKAWKTWLKLSKLKRAFADGLPLSHRYNSDLSQPKKSMTRSRMILLCPRSCHATSMGVTSSYLKFMAKKTDSLEFYSVGGIHRSDWVDSRDAVWPAAHHPGPFSREQVHSILFPSIFCQQFSSPSPDVQVGVLYLPLQSMGVVIKWPGGYPAYFKGASEILSTIVAWSCPGASVICSGQTSH